LRAARVDRGLSRATRTSREAFSGDAGISVAHSS
jgi:hypothetical protein